MKKLKNKIKSVLGELFPEKQREIIILLVILPFLWLLPLLTGNDQPLTTLLRPGFQEAEKNVMLSYRYQGEEEFSGSISVRLRQKEEEGSELRRKLERLAAELKEKVLNRNLQAKIDSARILPKQWRGVGVEYEFVPAGLLLENGEWNYFELFQTEKQREIVIRAVLRYQEEMAETEVRETVGKADFAPEYIRELLKKSLRRQMAALEREKTAELTLPKRLENGRLEWTALKSEANWQGLFPALLVAIPFLSLLSRAAAREKKRKEEKRYLKDFTQMLQQLVLLLKCGKSPFSAIDMICRKSSGFGRGFTLALESCRQKIYHQEPFAVAIGELCRFCPLPELQRFEQILLMAYERGDDRSILYLEQLKDELFADRLRRSHEYMQKTSSRLIFPMLLFLIIIIILTIFPAFEQKL